MGSGRGRHLSPQSGQGSRIHQGHLHGAPDRKPVAAHLRQLRRKAARIFPQRGQHHPRRAHPHLRSVQQPARPDQGTTAPDDRDHQGKPGKRTHQQPGLRIAVTSDGRATHLPADRRTHARRSGRTAHQGLERACLLPGAPAGDCGVWPRGHAPRHATAHGEPVWFAVHHLARCSADPQRQDPRR